MRLTAATVAKLTLPEGKSEHIIWDDEANGLGLRLRQGGSRQWIFQYRVGRKQRRITIGSATAITIAQARDGFRDGEIRIAGAKQLHAMVKDGQDPAGKKIETKAKATEIFGAVVQRFLEWQKTRKRKNGTIGLKPRTMVEVERHLLKRAKELHPMHVDSINQSQIGALLSNVSKENGPVEANRVRSSLSKFFNWAMKDGAMIPRINAAAFTNKHEEHARERVLAADELRSIWNALPDGDFADVIRLLMLTGQRREEIGGLLWSEIEDDNILLPSERTKNGRPHLVALSKPALAILKQRPRLAGRDLVFGFGNGGFSGWSKCKERLDAAIAEARKAARQKPMKPWHLHDLRRTMATRMAESKDNGGLAIKPNVVEAVLNHISGHKAGVAGIYNRASYDPEQADALNQWARLLISIVQGGEPKRKHAAINRHAS